MKETKIDTLLIMRDDVTKIAERDRCLSIIQKYLVFDSQRAVSWHEVQDCIEAIRKGEQ